MQRAIRVFVNYSFPCLMLVAAITATVGSGRADAAPRYEALSEVDKGDLPREELDAMTIATLRAEHARDSDYLDRLYARLTSGPIPHGFFAGKVIMPAGEGLDYLRARGLLASDNTALTRVAEALWGGKFFAPAAALPPQATQAGFVGYLKNLLDCPILNVIKGVTGLSLTPCQTSPELEVTHNGKRYPTSILAKNLYFPAKLSCGQSIFDPRRESIIIDYAYGIDDAPLAGVPVDRGIDRLAAREGLAVRDEVRRINPTTYLGRAHSQGAFLLYFVLTYVPQTGTEPTWEGRDQCWVGHQRQKARGMALSNFGNFEGK